MASSASASVSVCVNQILHGGGLRDVGFELGVIVVLTAIYFVLGTVLFRRRHQRV